MNSTNNEYIEKQIFDHLDVQIFSEIFVGSQKQSFKVILDTGSAVNIFSLTF